MAVADSKDEILELMDSIKEAKNEWKNAIANYEFAKDSEMVDYFTYKIKACEIMYQYFIRQAREKGIRIL